MNIHLYPSILKNETRIFKIVRTLRTNAVFEKVAVVGRHANGLQAHEDLGDGIHLYRLKSFFDFFPEGTLGKLLRTVGWYLSVLIWIRTRQVECVNCHSLPVLPLSVLLKYWKRCKLVYDTHELETETHVSNGLRKGIAKWAERVLINRVDTVCVVNKSIAAWYQKSYSLPHVWVVHNLPRRMTSLPKSTGLLRRAIGLDSPGALLFIYQGLLSSGRGIEILLDAFAEVRGERHLVCMGYGPFEGLVREASRLNSNIHFMPAVSPDKVKEYTVDADVGLSLIENTCLSYYLCAPNKLYEYAACGLAVVVTDFPEMRRFVDRYDCGWKVKLEADAFRRFIDSIDAQSIKAKRVNAARAGMNYCWENEEPELLSMYEALGLHSLERTTFLSDE
jgi:glycosyltransferase involved in cell wall biosynthesis